MTVELLHIDCMEYMATLEDNAFDLAIVDPPYGTGNNILKNGRTRTKLAKAGDHHYFDNSLPPPPAYFVELARVSKDQIIWGANHFNSHFNSQSSNWIVWNKHTTGHFADAELAYTSFSGSVNVFDYPWNGMIQGYHGTKSKNEVKIHPTQKPVNLYDWILHKYSDPAHRILDTHLGGGSIAIAAHYFGCNFVGTEIDQVYYDAASNRFNDATKQQSLFG